MNDPVTLGLLAIAALLVLTCIIAFIHAASSVLGIFSFAPYVPTAYPTVKKMMEAADVKPGMRVVELGSGDGRITIEAAKRGAFAWGVERDPILITWSRWHARWLKLQDRVVFLRMSVWRFRIPEETDVVMVYGLPMFMKKTWEKMKAECRPGTLLVSHAFTLKDVEPYKDLGEVIVYKLPEKS